MPLKIAMMGTGTFALPTFLALLNSEHSIVGLWTQPDRIGRGHHHHPHPMKEAAVERGVPVFQPDNVNTADSLTELRSVNADLFVVAAYGQILSAELLSIPRLGAVNLHASILPKYRGAAPIQYAVWKGETETGVTLFQIEPKLDAGPILGLVKTPIDPDETAGELEDRLAQLAVPETLNVVQKLEREVAVPLPQNSGEVTRARKLKKSDGEVPWHKSSAEIGWHLRAMQPWPMPFTFWHPVGKPPLRLQILRVSPVESGSELGSETQSRPGDILHADAHRVVVKTGDGAVALTTIRPEGKRAMAIAEFLHGHPMTSRDRLGPEFPERS